MGAARRFRRQVERRQIAAMRREHRRRNEVLRRDALAFLDNEPEAEVDTTGAIAEEAVAAFRRAQYRDPEVPDDSGP